MYDLSIQRVKKWLSDNKAKKVLIQAPDGIKAYLENFIESLEKEVEVFISGSRAWGGCDIALKEAKQLGIKHIIHIGHHGPVRVKIPENVQVFFVPAFAKISVENALENNLNKLGDCSPIGLLASLQHVNQLKSVKKKLENLGYSVVIGHGNLPFDGQIIGCDVSAAVNIARKVSCFLVIAGGIFHGFGVYIRTGKKTLILDPYRKKIVDIQKTMEKFYAKHLYNLAKALEAKKFGVLVSTKPGQYSINLARKIAQKIKKHGKKAYIIVTDEIEPETLQNFTFIDAYVNTACPRLNFDNEDNFKKPIIGAKEIDYVLENRLADHKIIDTLHIL
ncbi:MAG: diphthamide biosynthesis enzyme Dph2 [Thermofilum sp. ex4484_82]|nr:MAG: diphthamide biosynthesis enzyme Dph2 [Thermofilum sp. ex4484_82]OYT39939.1 MAG: diphthamide biosynthesis enzyme Dph2 [Archaeoglobales archaeon ex4484_92]RLE75324.1 MAG: diphthamide biosynthesis enzyme Dph2 [Thermoprotei archaeon]